MDPRTFPTKGNLMLAKNSLALVTPNLLGNGRRILVDSAGNLREIFPTADTMFNGSTISKGKVFFVSSSFSRHK